MADEPKPADSFDIPEPKIETDLVTSIPDRLSAKEVTAFSFGKDLELKRRHWDWRLRVVFRVLLFSFVLGINGLWSYEILRIVWRSGSSNSNFHLSDSVLIALVSTSIANFIGLVVIVARHLFPNESPK